MKHIFHILPKLAVVAAIALSASSCNRAQYAMLPKTTPYHGTERSVVVTPVPEASKPAVVAPAVPAEKKTVAVVTPAPAPAAAPVQASAPVSAAAPKAASKTVTSKPNLAQRLMLSKVAKKVEKATSTAQFKKHSETASANRLEGKLRQGLILILVGLLVGLLGAIGGIIGNIFAIVGSILFIVGVVLIILYLLDEV